MLQRLHIALIGAACLPRAALVRPASAQTLATDSIVRVHVITLDSTWYVTGQLLAVNGDSALVGCAVVGGGLGALGVLGVAFGDNSGGDGDGQFIAAEFAAALAVGGCALGAVVGAAVGAATHYTWDAITLPPRTGTEDGAPAMSRGTPDLPRALEILI